MLRQLLRHFPVGRSSRWGRTLPKPATRTPARLLTVEQLEDRTLLTTLAPLPGNGAPLPASDSAGGAAQIAISADGRFATYTSTAPNLVSGQVDTAVVSNV